MASKKLKDAINYTYVKLSIANIVPKNPILINIKKDFETACWSFKNNTHTIYIGDKLEKDLLRKSNLKEKIFAYLYHELGHANFTIRDFAYVNKELKREKISFQLFNLFEDARIEHLSRTNFGYSFNWTDFEELKEDSNNETILMTFFKIIQTENKKFFDTPYYEEAKKFYNKTISCGSFEELLEILKDFVNKYGNDIKNDLKELNQNFTLETRLGELIANQNEETLDEEGNISCGDLELSALCEEDEEIRNEMNNNCENIIQNSIDNVKELQESFDSERGVKYLKDIESSDTSTLEFSTSKDLFDLSQKPKKLNKKEKNILDRILIDLEKMFINKDITKINSKTSSNQFNIKNVIRHKAGDFNVPIYKKSVEEEDENKDKKIALILDLSGSMNGVPHKNQRILTVALNRLAIKKCIQGYIIGSKIGRKDLVHCQIVKLPSSEDFLLTSKADGGGEGIGYSIKKAMPYLKNCDHIFIFTDGQIHDLDLKFIKTNERDIYDKTIGIYVGEREHSNERFKEWFKNTIIEDDLLKTISKMSKIILSKEKFYDFDFEDDLNKGYQEENKINFNI